MINRKSTNLDIGLQSSSGIEGHLTGLMHHFHLPHHKVQLKKSFLGGSRRVVRGSIRGEKDDGRAVEAAAGSDAWSCIGAAEV